MLQLDFCLCSGLNFIAMLHSESLPLLLGDASLMYMIHSLFHIVEITRQIKSLMPTSHHRQVKTVLSCRLCEHNWRQDKTVFSSPHRILRLDKTVSKFLSPTVLTCRQFCSHRRHGQDKTVLSCPRCELSMAVQLSL